MKLVKFKVLIEQDIYLDVFDFELNKNENYKLKYEIKEELMNRIYNSLPQNISKTSTIQINKIDIIK